MSIYPVVLSKWFPAKQKEKHTWASAEDIRNWHDAAKMCVSMSKCCVCGKKPQFRYAWGLHSIPWGYGWGEIWCSKKCLERNDKSI